MSLFLNLKKENYHLAIWKLEESLSDLLAFFTSDHPINIDVGNFKNPKRALEWVAVRVLLYHILDGDFTIYYNENGKPYLVNGFYISISHTNGYIAVIISEFADVGIDIEYYSTRVKKVVSRFMREDEQVVFYNGDDVWNYLIHWSAKETMFKCIDDVEIDFKEHLHLAKFDISKSGLITAYEYKTAIQRIYNIHYLLGLDFVLTWCIVF